MRTTLTSATWLLLVLTASPFAVARQQLVVPQRAPCTPCWQTVVEIQTAVGPYVCSEVGEPSELLSIRTASPLLMYYPGTNLSGEVRNDLRLYFVSNLQAAFPDICDRQDDGLIRTSIQLDITATGRTGADAYRYRILVYQCDHNGAGASRWLFQDTGSAESEAATIHQVVSSMVRASKVVKDSP